MNAVLKTLHDQKLSALSAACARDSFAVLIEPSPPHQLSSLILSSHGRFLWVLNSYSRKGRGTRTEQVRQAKIDSEQKDDRRDARGAQTQSHRWTVKKFQMHATESLRME